MAQVRWTAEAQRWLKEIHDYIAQDSPDAAYRTVSGIHERAEILRDFPHLGYQYRSNRPVRVLLYGHYRIAYLLKADGDVDVLGVFHGALDVEKYLQ